MRGLTRITSPGVNGGAPRRLVTSYLTASRPGEASLHVDWGVGDRRLPSSVAPHAVPEPAPQLHEAADPPVVTRWEYLLVPLKDVVAGKKKARKRAEARLSELGAEGWEAVGLAPRKGARSGRPVVLLKRAELFRAAIEADVPRLRD